MTPPDGLCTDCGMSLVWTALYDDIEYNSEDCFAATEPDDHAGLCCDCYDEKFGMPAEQRSRPRP